jgi:hypothetical protein
MTDYVISNDANGSFTIPAATINTSLTSLALLGRGAPGYGLAVAQNTLSQLCNFASANAPANPLKGQIWFDAGHNVIKFYLGSSTWSTVAQVTDLANYAPLAAFQQVQTSVAALEANSATQAELANYLTLQQYYNPPSGSPPAPIASGGTGLTSVGSPGYVLTVNSSGNGYTFSNPASFVPSSSAFMRNDQTNLPTTDNSFSLGSTSNRYSNVYAVTFQGNATSANYADLAERYEADMPLEAGDVVMLGGEKEITMTTSAFCADVFGVISTAPAYMMNAEAGSGETHPFVALVGRVPVKVVGKVRKGQRIVSSSFAGVAMAADPADIHGNAFVVIGRALADKDTDDIGLLEITVGAK